MAMEEVGTPAEAKTEKAGAHLPPLVPVAVTPSEAEKRDAKNTSPEMMMMEPHSNVFDDIPNTNYGLDGVIPTEADKEASTEIRDRGKVAK